MDWKGRQHPSGSPPAAAPPAAPAAVAVAAAPMEAAPPQVPSGHPDPNVQGVHATVSAAVPAAAAGEPPSPPRVVLVQRIPPEVSVEDVIRQASKVGNVTGRYVQEKTRHVFVEFESTAQAEAFLRLLTSISVKGHQLRAELSLRYNKVTDEKVNKVLVLSLPGLQDGQTDCQKLAVMFESKGGHVQRMQLWLSRDGIVQGLIEMDSNESAQVLREQLNGYVMGTATVRLSYSNKAGIVIKQPQYGYDFAKRQGGGMCPRTSHFQVLTPANPAAAAAAAAGLSGPMMGGFSPSQLQAVAMRAPCHPGTPSPPPLHPGHAGMHMAPLGPPLGGGPQYGGSPSPPHAGPLGHGTPPPHPHTMGGLHGSPMTGLMGAGGMHMHQPQHGTPPQMSLGHHPMHQGAPHVGQFTPPGQSLQLGQPHTHHAPLRQMHGMQQGGGGGATPGGTGAGTPSGIPGASMGGVPRGMADRATAPHAPPAIHSAGGGAPPDDLGNSCTVLVKNLIEGTTPDALFRLFGTCGDVKAVKIIYKKRSTALVQYSSPMGRVRACQLLNRCPFYSDTRLLDVQTSKTENITGAEDELTRYYRESPYHRFSNQRLAQKNYENMQGPCNQLHISNVPVGVPNDEVEAALMLYSDGVVTSWMENKGHEAARTKMCIASLDNIRSAVAALIGLHTVAFAGHPPANNKGVVVSFSKAMRQRAQSPTRRADTTASPWPGARAFVGLIPDPTRGAGSALPTNP